MTREARNSKKDDKGAQVCIKTRLGGVRGDWKRGSEWIERGEMADGGGEENEQQVGIGTWGCVDRGCIHVSASMIRSLTLH